MSTSKVKSNPWGMGSTAIFVALLFFTFVILPLSLGQPTKYVNEKDQIFAAHVEELKSFPTTEVVTVKGSDGYLFHYYVSSGVDRNRYTLKEYVEAVRPVSKGVDKGEPIEGDRFIVPWLK